MSIGPSTLTIFQGSITDLPDHVGALVSSDDNHLSHGGGVSRALWRLAGLELESDPVYRDLRNRRSQGLELPTVGDVLVTGAGELRADRLFHAITIDFDRSLRLQPNQLTGLYGKVLDTALDLGLTSIALPLLGSGAARSDPNESAAALAEALLMRVSDPRGLSITLAVVLDGVDTGGGTWAEGPHLFDEAEAAARSLAPSVQQAFAAVRASWRKSSAEPPSVESAIQLLDAVDDAMTEVGDNRRDALVVAKEERDRMIRGRSGALPTGATPARPFIAAVVAALTSRVPEDPFAVLEEPALFHLPPSGTLGAAVGGRAFGAWIGSDSFEFLDHQVNFEPGRKRSRKHSKKRSKEGEPSHGPSSDPWTPDEGAMLDDERMDPATSLPPRPRVPLSSSIRVASGTSAVRKLRDLVWGSLTEVELSAIDGQLKALGYKGEPRERLLEHCAREAPDQILQDYFRSFELPELAKSLGFSDPSNDMRTLLDQILEGLGFAVGGEIDSLESLESSARMLARQLRDHDRHQTEAGIAGISKRIERLVRLQLRFITGSAFGLAPEEWATTRGLVRDVREFDRAGMGNLVGLLRDAAKELDEDSGVLARDLKRIVRPKSLVPKSLERIVALRNRAIHPSGTEPHHSMAEVQELGDEFCEQVGHLLEAWRKPDSGFPEQAIVESIHFDRWGRRSVSVSIGPDRLTVFTDHDLEPGQAYLMKHFTNPWSVDPLIVSRGGVPDSIPEAEQG